jgi:hypothetical protein
MAEKELLATSEESCSAFLATLHSAKASTETPESIPLGKESDVEKLRKSAHRSSLEQVQKVLVANVQTFVDWHNVLERDVLGRAEKRLSVEAQNILKQIHQAQKVSVDGFWRRLFRTSSSREKLHDEYNFRKKHTAILNSHIDNLKVDYLELVVELQAAVEELLASAGLDGFVNFHNPTLQILCEYRKNVMACEFLSQKCNETEELVERTRMAEAEMQLQCDEAKEKNRFIAAELNLMYLATGRQPQVSATGVIVGCRNDSMVSGASFEINSLLLEEQQAMEGIERETAALKEKFDGLAKEIEKFGRALGHGVFEEAVPAVSDISSAQSTLSTDAEREFRSKSI